MQQQYTFTKQEFELLEAGDYEARVDSAQFRATPNGKEYILFSFKIRDDVEQAGQNRLVFDQVWKEKENPTFYNRRRLNQLLGTQHYEDGKVFTDIKEVVTELLGAYLIVHVVKEFDEYRNAEVNRVAWYKSSKQVPQQLGENKEVFRNGINIANTNDDLPF